MKPIAVIPALLAAGALSGCAPAGPQADIAADKATIEKLYPAMVKEQDIETWAEYVAENPVFFPPDSPMLRGKQAIVDYYRQNVFSSDPNIKFHQAVQTNVEVSRGGDVAYSYGWVDFSASDSEGNPARGKSKWVKVWKKQPDGSWKLVINIWNMAEPLEASDE